MPLTKTISRVLKNGEETTETHRDGTLRTRYYRKSKTEMMNAIQHLVASKMRGWKVVHIQENQGEITVETRHAIGVNDVTITVFPVSPLRCAIDVASARRGRMGDFGTSYSDIISFFSVLNKEVPPEA